MCGPWMRCRFVTTMPRCATAGTVAQLSAPALSSWIHFEALAALDDPRRAEPDQDVRSVDGFGHAREISQAWHADDLDARRDAAERVCDLHVGHDDALRRSPARALANRRRGLAELEALDQRGGRGTEAVAGRSGLGAGRRGGYCGRGRDERGAEPVARHRHPALLLHLGERRQPLRAHERLSRKGGRSIPRRSARPLLSSSGATWTMRELRAYRRDVERRALRAFERLITTTKRVAGDGEEIVRSSQRASFVVAAMALLAGCGGGSGSSEPAPVAQNPQPAPTPAPAPAPTPAPTPSPSLSKEQAYRFLNQATFGATEAEAERLIALGNSVRPRTRAGSTSRWAACRPRSSPTCRRQGRIPTPPGFDYSRLNIQRRDIWFQNSVRGSDQLRQRVAWALSQIMVISQVSLANRIRSASRTTTTCSRATPSAIFAS